MTATGENKTGRGYQVEKGVIYCTEVDGGELYTDKEYADFVPRFDVKLTPNGNNGIAIRAPVTGRAHYSGMEIQILDDAGPEYREVRPEQLNGSIWGLFPSKLGAQKPAGQWNEQEITVKGRRISVKLNDKVIVDANLDDVKDKEKLDKHPG